jgi:hypothetical protein
MYLADDLGIEVPVPCPVSQCERRMLDLCAARHDLREVTAERRRKQRELEVAEVRFTRVAGGRSQ